MEITSLLAKVKEHNGSGLVLKAKSAPLIRVQEEIFPIGEGRLGVEDTISVAKSVTSEEQWQEFQKNLELDTTYLVKDIGRFRVNLFKQRGSVSVVFRAISAEIPTMESLGLPPVIADLAMRPRGLILVTSPAGGGKSTTQAAIIDHRNTHDECHIMTVEEPIEFIHADKKGMVNQRQVGRDTKSFANALKYVLRQDPDVILVGDMRDIETISMAITAAETGHLSIGTLHTSNAGQSIDRIINVFPSHQQQQIRMTMSTNLLAVISQVLVQKSDGQGQVACFEILVATPAVRNVIREGKTHQIPQLLAMGTGDRMVSMENSFVELVKNGTITRDEALSKSSRPDELANLLGPNVKSPDTSGF